MRSTARARHAGRSPSGCSSHSPHSDVSLQIKTITWKKTLTSRPRLSFSLSRETHVSKILMERLGVMSELAPPSP